MWTPKEESKEQSDPRYSHSIFNPFLAGFRLAFSPIWFPSIYLTSPNLSTASCFLSLLLHPSSTPPHDPHNYTERSPSTPYSATHLGHFLSVGNRIFLVLIAYPVISLAFVAFGCSLTSLRAHDPVADSPCFAAQRAVPP